MLHCIDLGQTKTKDIIDLFINEYWEKKPVVIKGTTHDIRSMVTEEHCLDIVHGFQKKVLDALKANNMRLVHQLTFHKFRFFINHRALSAPEMSQFLFNGNSLHEYFETIITKLSPDEQFGVIYSDAHLFSSDLFKHLLRFVKPIFVKTGIPCLFSTASLFMGNYKKTAFGIHQDYGTGIFTFCPYGKKSFLLWPPEYFDSKSYELFMDPNSPEYIRDALTLEIGPNDILYWPTNWWHVATQDVNSASISFAYFIEASLSNQILKMIAPRLKDSLKQYDALEGFYEYGETLPASLNKGLAELAVLFNSGEITSEINTAWANILKNNSLKTDFS